MKIKASVFYITLWMLFTTKANLIAQVFDGAQNQVSYIGGELSNYNYLTVGLDYGLTDYLSVGANIKYLFNPPEIPNKEEFSFLNRLGAHLRLDFHWANYLHLKKSDILMGYRIDLEGAHGPQIIYQYFFTDFFGLYGRSNYYVNIPKSVEYFKFRKPDPLTFEVGIIYKYFGW